jgi:hypothetical protein
MLLTPDTHNNHTTFLQIDAFSLYQLFSIASCFITLHHAKTLIPRYT